MCGLFVDMAGERSLPIVLDLKSRISMIFGSYKRTGTVPLVADAGGKFV